MMAANLSRHAAIGGLVWAAFQTAMMLYSGNLSAPTVTINVVPVLVLSVWALRSSRTAALGLAAYGAWRLWMAYPVIAQLLNNASAMPKHWWIAIVAIPFAVLWLAGGRQAMANRTA